MRTIWITTGLIGSGKSTWAKEFAKDKKIAIICRDELRTMVKGNYIYEKETEKLVKQFADTNILLALSQGWNIIIDEVHITKTKRQEVIEFIRAHPYMAPEGVKFVIVHFTEKENNIDNRMKSPRGYTREDWEGVYNNMLRSYEEPVINELPPNGQIMKPYLLENGLYKYDYIEKENINAFEYPHPQYIKN